MNRTARRLTGVASALIGVALVATACAGQPTTAAESTSDSLFDTDLTLDELIAAAKEEGPIEGRGDGRRVHRGVRHRGHRREGRRR
jgi:ABC-type glycerol-3-phosphate transport system substrate-binding protein